MEDNKFIKELFETKILRDEAENPVPLHSGITEKEGEFLYDIVFDHQRKNTLEIGCAYGVSSLFICAASSKFENYKHTIIDPFQKEWQNIGILNLKRAGFTSFELIEKLSEIALPQLLEQDKKYDFAFIDGWHTFDHVLIDFFYVNRMMDVGGIIAFHDVDMPSINKLLRYILKYPAYELIGSVETSFAKKTFNANVKEALFVTPLRLLSKVVPKRNHYELLSGKIIDKDSDLKINSTLVAIRKVKADERDWRWFDGF
jgi:predicted O-methyltransferase YrrM